MNKRFHSLALKVSFVVVLVEIAALAIIGAYYINRFYREIDHAMETQIRIPANLMALGLLSYDSVGDQEIMKRLVGETILDACFIGVDNKVYYALKPEDIGRKASEVLNPTFVDYMGKDASQYLTLRDEKSMVNFSPLHLDSVKLLGFLQIKVGLEHLEKRKTYIALLFIVGSFTCVIFTSIAILYLLNTMALRRIRLLAEAFTRVEREDRTVETESGCVPSEVIGRGQDEITSLGFAFSEMIQAIQRRVSNGKAIAGTAELF